MKKIIIILVATVFMLSGCSTSASDTSVSSDSSVSLSSSTSDVSIDAASEDTTDIASVSSSEFIFPPSKEDLIASYCAGEWAMLLS